MGDHAGAQRVPTNRLILAIAMPLAGATLALLAYDGVTRLLILAFAACGFAVGTAAVVREIRGRPGAPPERT